MKVDVYTEIIFNTARSGGKGGQNVNKVETMVEGRWKVEDSAFFSQQEKELIQTKLRNKITSEGYLLVKSQVERNQLGNKQRVVEKINLLIEQALHKKKSRVATKPSKAAKEKRIQGKKIISSIKENRRKFRPNDL